MKKSQEEILAECKKCKDSPYYFATTYLTVKNYLGVNVPFKTNLTEVEFNNMFKDEDK